MNPTDARTDRIFLRADVLIGAVILAFTALPTQLRIPNAEAFLDALKFQLYPVDAFANVLAYVPLGLALAYRRTVCAVLLSSALSSFAEGMQLFSVGREPAIADVVANVAGAIVGLALALRWQLLPERVAVSPRGATLAAAAAIAYVAAGATFTVDAMLGKLTDWLDAPPWMTTNPRGATPGGILEGHWSFDGPAHDVVGDVSGHGLRGTIAGAPTLASGPIGPAILLDGRQWVDLGAPVSLRLTGSMTLSAWIRPLAFPVDDAAIISSLTDHGLGYQLDLTIDQGPRTIGFKISNASGQLMARYGRTPIVVDRWYHVAGVYDAASRTLHVYLDGRRDDGCLMGAVTDHQQASGKHVFIGRRAGSTGYEFIGSIDEAKIQSRPQSSSEIAAEVGAVARLSGAGSGPPPEKQEVASGDVQCIHQEGPRPPRVAGMLVSLGMAIALACAGLWHRARLNLVVLALCFATGASAIFWPSLRAALHPAWLALPYIVLGGLAVMLAARPERWPSARQ